MFSCMYTVFLFDESGFTNERSYLPGGSIPKSIRFHCKQGARELFDRIRSKKLRKNIPKQMYVGSGVSFVRNQTHYLSRQYTTRNPS